MPAPLLQWREHKAGGLESEASTFPSPPRSRIVGLAVWIILGDKAPGAEFPNATTRNHRMAETQAMSQDQKKADWFHIALFSVGDGVILTDLQSRVTFLNPVAESLTGWSATEATGRPLIDIFTIVNERDRLPVENPVAQVLSQGRTLTLPRKTVLIARGGTECPIDDSAAPIRDGTDELVGAVLVFSNASERRRAERAEEEARAFAEAIVATVREPLVVLDAEARVRSANQAFYLSFGLNSTAAEGRSLFDLCNGQGDVSRLRTLLSEVVTQDRPFDNFQWNRTLENGSHRALLLNARRIDRPDGGSRLILLAIEDVTDRQEAAHALAVSESRYRRLFETAQDGILILDAETRLIDDANPFLSAILGYSRDELVGKELWEIGLFKNIEVSKEAFRTLMTKGYIRYEDLPLRTREGHGIEVEFVSNVYQVDDRPVIQCNIRDVTDRKRAEAAVQAAHEQLESRVQQRTAELAQANESLKAEVEARKEVEAARQDLLRRLVTAEEDERRRIARELHDQMGQHLAALGLGLKWMRGVASPDSIAERRLQELQELNDRLGQEVHNLALELRPTALDDLGLNTVLTNYAEEWSARSGVNVDFQGDAPETGRLPPDIETALYRVVQEALTNVLKHAQAQHVSLILQRSAVQVLLIIEDDGCGFDGDGEPKSGRQRGRLGLLGMQERLALVGGTLTVEATAGNGTTIFARVPLSLRERGGQP